MERRARGATYKLVVRGELDSRFAYLFSGMQMKRVEGTTVLAGSVVDQAVKASQGSPILAEPLLAERVAVEGGRVYVANPLDAFARDDQRAYLDWLQGRPGATRAIARAGLVALVRPGSDVERRTARTGRYRRVAEDDDAVLFVRRR